MLPNIVGLGSSDAVGHHSKVAWGMACVILSAVLFGWMPFLAKLFYSYGGNAYMASFGRFLFGTLLSALVLKIRRQPLVLNTAGTSWTLFMLSVFYAGTPLFLYKSYLYVGSGLATALHFAYPVFVLILMGLLFHESFTWQGMGSMALCVMGIFLLCDAGFDASIFGMAIAVFSGVLYAAYIVILGRSTLLRESVFALTFWICLLAAMELALAAIITGNFQWNLPWQAWGADFCLGLFSTVMALPLFQQGVMLCGEVKASLLSTFEPVTGVLVGISVFGEIMTIQIAVGILLILGATAVLSVPVKKQVVK